MTSELRRSIAWEIPDDDAGEAVAIAIEALGLILGELLFTRLGNTPNLTDPKTALALRGLGTFSGRMGMSHLTWLAGVDERGQRRRYHTDNPLGPAAAERARLILEWLFVFPPGGGPPVMRPPSPPPPTIQLAIDELHASANASNRKAATKGLGSPRRIPRIVRGDHHRGGP